MVLQRDVRAALAIGAVVPPFRASIEALKSPSDYTREEAASLLSEVAHAAQAYWTPVAVERCLAMLECVPLDEAFSRADADAIRKALLDHKWAPNSVPAGTVNTLIDAHRTVLGEPVGVVRPMSITSSSWGGTRAFSGAVTAGLATAFSRGARIAHHYVQRRGLTGVSHTVLLRSRSYEGEFVGLSEMVGGPSIGLAAGIGILSSLFDYAVPTDVAFTGEVRNDGAVTRVGGLDAKLTAAREMGLKTVWCPDQPNVPQVDGIEISRVTHFDPVVEKTFPASAIEAGVRRLRNEAAGVRPHREWLLAEDDASARRQALISMVGGSDPWTPNKPEDTGAILAIAEWLPTGLDVAYLFHTSDDQFRAASQATAEQLRKRGVTVREKELSGVTDATDFELVYLAVRDACYEALDELAGERMPEETAVYVNVTSGTPQMMIALHMLAEQEILPDRRLQVAPPSKAGPEGRVRRVSLPPPLP